MDNQQPPAVNLHKMVLEINKRLNHAADFDSAIASASEELKIALDVEQIQIILHRTEQNQ